MANRQIGKNRADLGYGHMTDFELANAVFLVERSDLQLIAYQTAAKERIRWLSAQLAALLAASSVSPATGFEVAKLEWVRPIGAMAGETLRRVETAFGTYRVWTHAEANGAWYWALRGGFSQADGSGTEEECFAAAQTDFDRRVRSCLAPQPSSTDSEVKQ